MIATRSLTVRIATALAFSVLMLAPASAATEVERVVSPLGIEAWLVRSPTAPLIAIDFAFRGGSSQDPTDKAGVASLVAGLIDEGAGDLNSRAFHEQLEANAIGLSFSASRDQFNGSLRTLLDRQDKAFDLTKLSLTAARFDAGRGGADPQQSLVRLAARRDQPEPDREQTMVGGRVSRAPL